ncbi:hypothetical protein Naga_103048g1 [Nannochloropsis gaditana]|uniref:Uncharacterized protein n=1 Tax=Nannochloropsis gaditana TaxID=72520 RepID=W7TP15_9STRA|nr:hypothetical protein Naga_103048g1 [Nannochloropsis gaditana]
MSESHFLPPSLRWRFQNEITLTPPPSSSGPSSLPPSLPPSLVTLERKAVHLDPRPLSLIFLDVLGDAIRGGRGR